MVHFATVVVKGESMFTDCYSPEKKDIFIQQLIISGSDATLAGAALLCHVAFVMFLRTVPEKSTAFLYINSLKLVS